MLVNVPLYIALLTAAKAIAANTNDTALSFLQRPGSLPG